jgi:hypothetical protein
LALDEAIVKFKGTVGDRKYIPKSKRIWNKLCDSNGYTQYMPCYLGKERANVTTEVIPTHATMFRLIRETEGVGHKGFIELFFFAPIIFGSTYTKTDCYENIR